MKELCLLIPTKNRAMAIDFFLKEKIEKFREKEIDVIIFDSSTNDETENVVKKYLECGYENIVYQYYKDYENDGYGSYKVRDAYRVCAQQYEYIWLCGDTTIIQIENVYSEVKNAIDKKCDIIHVYRNPQNRKTGVYTDCVEFLELFYWSMTHWCSYILSRDIVTQMDKYICEFLENGRPHFNIIVYSIYKVISDCEFTAYYVENTLYTVSPYRQSSNAHLNKDLLRTWAEATCIGIDELPDIYNGVKKSVKLSINENMELFSLWGGISLRADGNISIRKLNEYKRYLVQMTSVPLAWFYLWAAIPREIAQMLVECKRVICDIPGNMYKIYVRIKMVIEHKEDDR